MRHLILVIAIFLYSGMAAAFSYTLEIPEAEMQAKAEAMMPMEKKKFFITAILTNPKIDLIAATNEINLSTNVQIRAPGNISGAGVVSFTGALRYENDPGSFYFDNFNVNTLEIENIPPAVLPKVKKVLEFVAKKFLEARPVYKFKDDDLKHKLAKSVLKSLKVEDEILFVELGIF